MAKPSPLTIDDPDRHIAAVRAILDEVAALEVMSEERLAAILRRHPRDGNGVFSKNQLVSIYRLLCARGEMEPNEELVRRIQMRPIRTLSGVAPVTVLTKPWPCPGQCIFCPTDVRMPKSYLHDEPGAMRAEQHGFDPYRQTAARIAAFESNGHPVDKIELLVLGGTWSSYPHDYQERFIQRCLDAMNDAGGRARNDGRDQVESLTGARRPAGLAEVLPPKASGSLEEAQRRNESARCRNVGLVLETRPDHVTMKEILRLRRLGATKIQMGAQSLDDRILQLNRRGHTVEDTCRAMTRLRAASFKLVLHWMPNLHSATVEGDLEDFGRLFDDPALRPDEIKIYSTSLLADTELYDVWRRGEYQPYDDERLIELIIACKERVPRYCRINRIYRDIPSHNVVAGCKRTNLRQHLQQVMRRSGRRCGCLRCREVREHALDAVAFVLHEQVYRTHASQERFLSFDDPNDRCAGYLRLSLPNRPGFADGEALGLPELEDCALVREVHVYGPALRIGRGGEDSAVSASQHRGLGRRLLERAEDIASDHRFRRMAIIASVGTRAYYRKYGYRLEGSYMVKEL